MDHASRAGRAEVDAKIDAHLRRRAACRVRATRARCPTGNDGLGLMLLGVSGDEVLPRETYEKIRAATLSAGARHGAGRHPQGGPGAEHLHLLDRVRAAPDGRHPAVLHRQEGPELLLGLDLAAITSPRPGRTRSRQLAFTLANGFTFVEYYLSRGMHIDDFAPNLSFFFSNGMDPEYAVHRPRRAPDLGARRSATSTAATTARRS